MKGSRRENQLVVILFMGVLICFSLAERDSRRMTRLQPSGGITASSRPLTGAAPAITRPAPVKKS